MNGTVRETLIANIIEAIESLPWVGAGNVLTIGYDSATVGKLVTASGAAVAVLFGGDERGEDATGTEQIQIGVEVVVFFDVPQSESPVPSADEVACRYCGDLFELYMLDENGDVDAGQFGVARDTVVDSFCEGVAIDAETGRFVTAHSFKTYYGFRDTNPTVPA